MHARGLRVLLAMTALGLACGSAHADPGLKGAPGLTSMADAPRWFGDLQTRNTVAADQGTPVPAPSPQPITEAVQFAVADLASRLGIEPATIAVLSVEDVTWSDSSLGCPREGMAYMQVLTPGQRIRLGVDTGVYEYHGGRTAMPRYCENPEPPVSDTTRLDGPLPLPEPIVVPSEPPK